MVDNENLIVYQRALEFIKFADTIIGKQKVSARLYFR